MRQPYELIHSFPITNFPAIERRRFVFVVLCFFRMEIPSVLLEDAERTSLLGTIGSPSLVPFQVSERISRLSTAGRVEPQLNTYFNTGHPPNDPHRWGVSGIF